jgi:transcription antitermination protein NusB
MSDLDVDADDEDRPAASPAEVAKSPQRALFAARTRGRELALKFLYQWDLRRGEGGGDRDAFDAFADFVGERGTAVEFGRRLVAQVIARHAEIDERLKSLAKNWSLHRMATVDRNILRLGAAEMTLDPPSPPGVAINEAVELGKRYGAQQSGKFVNGLLDKLARTPGFLPAAPAAGPRPAES